MKNKKYLTMLASCLRCAVATPLMLAALYSSQALAITVSSSDDDGNVAMNTLDNNLNTRWSANGDGQWLNYDLGTVITVDSVAIAFYKGDQRDASIDIEVSSDNSRWILLFSGTQPRSTTGLQSFELDDTPARYVRITGYGNTANSWNSITEVDIFTGSTPNPTPTPVVTQAPSEVTASASSDDGNVASNVLDDDLSTRWSADGDGQWLQLNLASLDVIDSVDMAFYKGDQRTASFDIQVSTNASSWSTVYSGVQNNSTTQLQNIDFANTLGQYVRIVGYGNTSNSWNSLTEVRVNTGGSVMETPTPTPTIEPGDFDLLDWYLSIPADNGNGLATSIKENELASGYQDFEYFWFDSDGGMVFKCPIAGTKTSSGTSYTRTELREMLRRGDTNIATQGVNKNNWVFGSASSATRDAAGGYNGTLKATLAVNHVTTTGSTSQRGRVIIGQIHANSDEPMRLYYRKLPNNAKGSIYFAHEIESGSDQYVEIIGDRDSSSDNPSDGIALNEVFSYEVNVSGSALTVKIMRDGKPTETGTYDMSDSGYTSSDDYMYFKAGVYNQNNSGDDEDYVQATFYSLENTHTGYTP